MYVIFIFQLSQPLGAGAVMMPLPLVTINYPPIEESRIRTTKNYPQIASIPELKLNKIQLMNKQMNHLALQLNSGSIRIEEFISTIRGGDNEKLIKSIISKVSEAEWDIPSINKILKKLAELKKPIPQSSIFVEGWVNPLPRHRKRDEVESNGKYDSRGLGPFLVLVV